MSSRHERQTDNGQLRDLLHDYTVPAIEHLEAAAAGLRFSKRESTVAALLIDTGSGVQSVAGACGIATETARTYKLRGKTKAKDALGLGTGESWSHISFRIVANAARKQLLANLTRLMLIGRDEVTDQVRDLLSVGTDCSRTREASDST